VKASDLIPYAILAGAAYLVWQTFSANRDSPCPLGILDPACLAREAGKATGGVASTVYNYFTTETTAAKSMVEDPWLPSTRVGPQDYIVNAGGCDPLDFSGGPNACMHFGSSSGQSPEDFCRDSPSSPICVQVEQPWYHQIPFLGGFM
jgi:hypothetical protein